jgi:hypothetical protein
MNAPQTQPRSVAIRTVDQAHQRIDHGKVRELHAAPGVTT